MSRTCVATVCVTAKGVISCQVYFDYLCPFVYRMAVLLDAVRGSGQRKLEIGWHYFSLSQVNAKDDGWTVWEASAATPVRGRLAFQAAEAARRQGKFEALHLPLLQARHRDRLDIDDTAVVERVAGAAGLDLKRFRLDLADPTILEPLALDHRIAVGEHGIFGTPTLVFANGAAAYVRLATTVESESAVEVFDRVLAIAESEPRILELKRPVKPAT